MEALMILGSALSGVLAIGAGMVIEDATSTPREKRISAIFATFFVFATIMLAYGAGRVS